MEGGVSEPDIQKYCDLMAEIKLRISVVDFFFTGGGHALYKPTTIESVGLQLRKVMELIAFGSLVANKEAYSAAYNQFAKQWNARLLLRDLGRINQDFYPKPVVEVPHPDPRVVHQLKDRGPDYLSQEEFERAYEKCGAIMHAVNPYGSQIDYEYYRIKLPEWRTRIVNLLNNHQIRLVGEKGFYVVHMKEDHDDKVHYYKFEPPATG
jgi:hypothetical protein